MWDDHVPPNQNHFWTSAPVGYFQGTLGADSIAWTSGEVWNVVALEAGSIEQKLLATASDLIGAVDNLSLIHI